MICLHSQHRMYVVAEKKLVLLQWNTINCFLSILRALAAKQKFSVHIYDMKLTVGLWSSCWNTSNVPLVTGIVPTDFPFFEAYWKSSCDVVELQPTAWKLAAVYTNGYTLKHTCLSRDEKFIIFWDRQYFKFNSILWLLENMVYKYIIYIYIYVCVCVCVCV